MNTLSAKAILGISVLVALIVAAPAQASVDGPPTLSISHVALETASNGDQTMVFTATPSPDWRFTGGDCSGMVTTDRATWFITTAPSPHDVITTDVASSTQAASVSVTCPVVGNAEVSTSVTSFSGNEYVARIVTPYVRSGGCNLASQTNGDENTRCIGARAQVKYHFTLPPDANTSSGKTTYALSNVTHNVLAGVHGCRNSGWVISGPNVNGRYTAMFHQASKGTHISQCDIVNVKFHYTETQLPDMTASGSWSAQ